MACFDIFSWYVTSAEHESCARWHHYPPIFTTQENCSNTIHSSYNGELIRDQYDVVYDVKRYTNNQQELIRIENVNNDIPRQKMENEKEKIQTEVNDHNSEFTMNQDAAINGTKIYLEGEEEIKLGRGYDAARKKLESENKTMKQLEKEVRKAMKEDDHK